MSMENADGTPLDTNIFFFDEMFQIFDMYSSDTSDIGTYNLEFTVRTAGYSNPNTVAMTVTFTSPCGAATLNIQQAMVPSTITYNLYHPADIQSFSDSHVTSDVDPAYTCPDIEIAVENQDGSSIDTEVFYYEPVLQMLSTFS